MAVEADKGQFTLALDSGEEQGKEMVVTVPGDLKIALNPMPGIAAPPVQLADLKVGDRVVVRHMPGEWKRQATELTAQRVVTLEGTVVDQFDAKKNRLTVTVGGKPLDLPVTPDCEVTINDQRVLDQKILRPGDLRAGDDVVVSHDARVVRIDAQRILGQAGVVRQVHFDAHTLDVILTQGNRPVTFLVGPQCKIASGGRTGHVGRSARRRHGRRDARFARRRQPGSRDDHGPASRRPGPLGHSDQQPDLRRPIAGRAAVRQRRRGHAATTRWSIATRFGRPRPSCLPTKVSSAWNRFFPTACRRFPRKPRYCSTSWAMRFATLSGRQGLPGA